MRRAAVLLFAVALAMLAAVPALAQQAASSPPSGNSVDLSGNFATEPDDGFGNTLGVEAGVNLGFENLGLQINIDPRVRTLLRASLGYYDWDRSVPGGEQTYQRIPLFLGTRFAVTAAPSLQVFGDLGFEVSLDEEAGDDDIELGLRPQAGVIYPINNMLSATGTVAFHIIDDPYFTIGVGLQLNLP
jgi:hypothetical protein